ncbi:MAG: WYL domain-containing protein [Propionibacteriaceae bacterium]|nr:WYL domain-containing protein [Propionibacteriaceae bacterium]
MTSNAQVTRLLALVPYLQKVGVADLGETAAFFSVTKKQLLNDLNVLLFCGLPGGFFGDLFEIDQEALETGTIVFSNADFLARPMRFTPDEASSLIVALQAIAEIADTESSAAARSALHKLTATQNSSAQIAVHAQAGTSDLRTALLAAIREKRSVQLTYAAASHTGTTTPIVEPVRILTRDGFGYLQAWSSQRDSWRVYRLDRIFEVAITDEPTCDPGEPPPFDSGWLEQLTDAVEIELEVSAAVGWIGEYYPMRSSERTPDGWIFRMLVADPRWLNGLLLRLGDQVKRVSNPAALASAKQSARETLSAYQVR